MSAPHYAPFLTGSHAYGTPHDESDIDLAVYVEGELREFLKREGGGQPTRFGKLNLIPISDPATWDAWKKGTQELVEEKKLFGPVSREYAIDYLNQKRDLPKGLKVSG